MKKHRQLTFEDRIYIEVWHFESKSFRYMARRLGVHVSTISREIQRGKLNPLASGYRADLGVKRRRQMGSKKGPRRKIVGPFAELIKHLIKRQWSPEEIVQNKKIITTDQFTDKDGNAMSANDAGMPGDWPESSRVTIEFQSLGTNQSQIHIRHEGIPKKMHDDCVSGWSSSINKLQRLVEHS